MMNKFLNNFNRVSKLFQPVKPIPKGGCVKYDDVAKSYKVCYFVLLSSII